MTSNRIRELRKKKGLTLKELSQQLKENGVKLSASSLIKYERGERNPSLENWINLANFFGVSVSYLQGLTDDENTFVINDLKDLDSKLGDSAFKPGNTVKIKDFIARIATNEEVKKHFIHDVLPNIISDNHLRFFSEEYSILKRKSEYKKAFESLGAFLDVIGLYMANNATSSYVKEMLDDFLDAFNSQDNGRD